LIAATHTVALPSYQEPKTGETGETRALVSFFDFELRFSSPVSPFSPAGFDE
jgi:hypothetical protein